MTPNTIPPVSDSDAVEVVDAQGRPLGVLAADEAHRQMLRHHSATVLVFDRQARLCLHKRPAQAQAYPGRWDLTLRRHPEVGQSLEEAALAELAQRLPHCQGALTRHARLPASEHTGFEFMTFFRTTLPQDAAAAAWDPDECLFIGHDELTALSREFRDLFTPMVIHALEQGVLYKAADEASGQEEGMVGRGPA